MDPHYDLVVDVIATRFGIDRAAVLPECSFDDLDLDSLAQVELATALQKRLGQEIDDEEMAQLSRISEVVDMVRAKKAGD